MKDRQVSRRTNKRKRIAVENPQGASIAGLLQHHFSPTPLIGLAISGRSYHADARADIQRALNRLFESNPEVVSFSGVRPQFSSELSLAACAQNANPYAPSLAPPEYFEFDEGAAEPMRCLRSGLWLVRAAQDRYAVLLSVRPANDQWRVHLEIATTRDARGESLAKEFFDALAKSTTCVVESASDLISTYFMKHFAPEPIARIAISERTFPRRVHADLQRAIDSYFSSDVRVLRFSGINQPYSHESVSLTKCLNEDRYHKQEFVPPLYMQIDIGEPEPIRCLKSGIWFVEEDNHRYVVLYGPNEHSSAIRMEVAVVKSLAGEQITGRLFNHFEKVIKDAHSYRGKVLSLESGEDEYSGRSQGIRVHRLANIDREQVVLPRASLTLLDRNVIEFCHRRSKLAELGQSTKKGVLFYGPPGTGKTHTIQYLARALPAHTTLLITAGQVGLLREYMTLARLLQPSIVVLEDVDLIARSRESMGTCEEVLLNELLNEMDGLRESADILFILTTNRPESLERALSSRPGRVDQAIEFPLPDAEGRKKLVELYRGKVDLADDIATEIVSRTEKVSAAFIKELMRRSAQFQLERADAESLELCDVDAALDEMLFAGGSLNLKLLGADVSMTQDGADET